MTSICKRLAQLAVLLTGGGMAMAEPPAAEPISAARATAQVEFTEPVPLLAPDGSLSAWGWARRGVMQYNREAIPAEQLGRVKEWEHYTIMSPQFTAGVTIVQLGGITAASAELIDYKEQVSHHAMFMAPVPKSTAILPADPYGSTEFARGKNRLAFSYADGQRQITGEFVRSALATAMQVNVTLADPPEGESVAITRPFEEPGQFFYENKIFGLPATGTITVAGREFQLPEGESWAIFDWGRGIWPAESSWFWGQAAGRVGQQQVAINLGHGYGDDSHGTCNAILVDGKLHKLDIVECEFDPQDRMQPWMFTSNDGRLQLTFVPTYNQHSQQDVGFASAELHKIHGHYSGTLVLDDGTELQVKDLLGFAEHMRQQW